MNIVVPASAVALPPVAAPTPDPVATALARAQEFWGAIPCAGDFHAMPDSTPQQSWTGGTVTAWVTLNRTLPFNDKVLPTGEGYRDCIIHVSTITHPTPASMLADWPGLCRTITHEYGHLLGHVHSTDPTSIMFPELGPQMSDPPCDRTV